MSPTPEEWEQLRRNAPDEWRILINAELRHIQANQLLASTQTSNKLNDHEDRIDDHTVRLVKLETRLGVYAAIFGFAGGALVAAIISVLQ